MNTENNVAIRVVIIDDQEVVRKGLEIILRHSAGIEVVGSAADGEAGVALVAETKPDVALMDLKMPRLNGIHATRKISAEHATTKVVVLTTYDGDGWVFDAIRAGATGYLLKDSDSAEIVAAIHDAAAGRARLDPAIAAKILREFTQTRAKPAPAARKTPHAFEKLTKRELSIIQLIAQGKTNSDIAGTLFLAQGTIKNNVSNILAKLHSNDRTQAVLAALRHGIVYL